MPTLALSMIVRNEAATIRPCLESVAGIVGQIVIADTGSTDATPHIAREYGVEVMCVPWENHFAKARNAALARVSTDWVLALDADEELDRGARSEMPALLRRAEIAAYRIPIRNYLLQTCGNLSGIRAKPNDSTHERARNARSYVEHSNVRLFRNRPDIRYRGCIHEAVEDGLVELGLHVADASLLIHHFGHIEGSGRQDVKDAAYLDLLRAKVEEEPRNPRGWLELAWHIECTTHDHEQAYSYLERSLQLEPRNACAWLYAGRILFELGRYERALDALARVGASDIFAVEREHCRGDVLHDLGMLGQAQQAYERALKLVGHDPEIASKLGYTEVRLGERRGVARMSHAVAEAPMAPAFHDRLVKALVALDELEEAGTAAENWARTLPHPRLYFRAAAIRVRLKQQEAALRVLDEGLQLFPDATDLQAARAELGGSVRAIDASVERRLGVTAH